MIKIVGVSQRCAKEFIRSWLWASVVVLSYHNYPLREPILVKIVPKSHPDMQKNHITGGSNLGIWDGRKREILVRDDQESESMAAIIVHEMIHALMGPFEKGSNEKVTSTLTAKLKHDIGLIAVILQAGDNSRRAKIAHASISYPTREGEDDRYDPAQWEKVGAIDHHKKQHKKRIKKGEENGEV